VKYALKQTVYWHSGHPKKISGIIIHTLPKGTIPGVFSNYYIISVYNNVDEILTLKEEGELSDSPR
jgi:hypothetical protein